MELLGKVIISLGGIDPLGGEGLAALAKKGAAIVLISKSIGSAEEGIANRIRRHRGKVALIRGESPGGQEERLVRDVIAEFGRIDGLIFFAHPPALTGTTPNDWADFMSREIARPLSWMGGLQQAHYPPDRKTISMIGVLLSPGPSPLIQLWEALWQGLGSFYRPDPRNQPTITFTAISVTGVGDEVKQASLAEGFKQLLSFLTSDPGASLKGQVLTLS